MGQPIAIVRASLDLQLQGLPVVNQDWAIFKKELQKFQQSDRQPIERETNGFTDVQFPIYLGNYQSLNDGLVGYWREIHNPETGITLSPKLYIPVGKKEEENQEINQNSKIIFNQHQPLNRTLRSPPEFITALIDPRAALQIPSRILPTKFVQIPSEHYANIINQISLSFLTAPLLSCGRINIALADIPNYNLLWLEQQSPEQWLKISNRGKIDHNQLIAHYQTIRLKLSNRQNIPSGEQVLEYLLREEVGWLEPISNESTYLVIPTDKRTSKTLEPPYQSLQKSINVLLDILADKVRPTTTEAILSQSEIYEGWLQLTPWSQK